MCRLLLFVLGLIPILDAAAADTSWYRAVLHRDDKVEIPFRLGAYSSGSGSGWVIANGAERLYAINVIQSGDSVRFDMPAFESSFSFAKKGQRLQGKWIRGAGNAVSYMDFSATERKELFDANHAHGFESGRWQLIFTMPDGRRRPAIGIFHRKDNHISGSMLTPSGDYRYLNGIVSNRELFLSTFDGVHAFFFRANIENQNQISNGLFYSGNAPVQKWEGYLDANAALPDSIDVTPRILYPDRALSFRFPDLDSNLISFPGDQFAGKVTVIQLMGSWCPNCLDETRFLSDYVRSHPNPDIAMIGLAYEASTDFARSQKSLLKFKNLFDVPYPMLITGVTPSDPDRAAKTLPLLDKISVFPSTIFVGRDGHIKKVHTGFYGPGTGGEHEKFKAEFEQILRELLKENPESP